VTNEEAVYGARRQESLKGKPRVQNKTQPQRSCICKTDTQGDSAHRSILGFVARSFLKNLSQKNKPYPADKQMIKNSLDFVNKKVLIKKTWFAFSAVPSTNHLAPNASEVLEGERKIPVPS
jgi:hypothetical protein